MIKSEIRILIVEDDPSFGKAVEELFRRAGYDPMLLANPEQALKISEHHEFHALVIDCMLPKMNGVDLAQKLLQRMDPKPPLFLMTGVFRDKAFIKDALTRTGALLLLSKPFHMDKLLALVEKELKTQGVDADLDPLASLLMQAECSAQQVLDAFAKQASFHSFNFPLVLSLFARQGMTGELNIVSTDREVSQVTFIEGKIVDVRSQTRATQLGELLVEFGFAMPEDVEEALNDRTASKPIGRRLVDAGNLSPHAIGLIREEQLAIRLSQMIQNTSIEISWLKRTLEMKDTFHALPPSRLRALMSEWILSKIPAEWLRSFYLPFAEYVVSWRGKAAMKIDGAKMNLPMLPEILERIGSQPTLQDLLVEAGDKELNALQAVHALVLERKIYFGERRKSANDYQGKIKRYERLFKTFGDKNLFEILGISQKARASEVHRAYTDLAKQFHPDKLPPEAPQQLKDLCHKIFAQITHSYNTLSNDQKRQQYIDEMGRKEANRVFEMEPLFEKALGDLRAQKYKSAFKKLEELVAAKAPMPDLQAYYYWAKIKTGSESVSEQQFFSIPPEHRHSPVYMLAKGLYYKSIGQFQKALECFQNARFMDKRFSEAQRELVELIDEAESKKNDGNTFLHRLLGGGSKPVKKKRSA